MSKELEALDRLIAVGDPSKYWNSNYFVEDVNIVKQALQRLEAIDNTSPSEALKWLDQIIEYITEDKKVKYKATILFDCEIIKDALLKAQEMEKGNVYCAGGRSFSKEVIYLKQSIEQCNDKPIYYISRSFGNKYIVPQKLFEEQEKENARYKKLEEELGCPLEVYVGINQCDITTVYDKNGIEYTIKPNTIIKESFFAVDGFTLIECMWNMYRKTWWLKKDKSE